MRWLRRFYGWKYFLISISGLAFIILLGLQWKNDPSFPDQDNDRALRELGQSGGSEHNIQDGRNPSANEKVVDVLNQEIEKLKNELQNKMDQLKNIKTLTKDEKKKLVENLEYPSGNLLSSYVNSQIDSAYVLRPHAYRNEYTIPMFASFTRQSIRNRDFGLVKQPEVVLAFFVDLQNDLLGVIEKGSNVINDPNMDFAEGSYRIQYGVGTQYELVFSSIVNSSAPMRIVTLFRPFAPLRSISTFSRDITETVQIIVPLQGRGDSFRRFMDNFEIEAIIGDGHIFLTVVCYGAEAFTDATEILGEFEKKLNFKSYQVVEGQLGEFSRGRALQDGTTKVQGENPLMFFCDVDMFFTSHFLKQCRSQTKPGSKVFYPIVFSLYNPEIVYKGKAIPPLKEQQVIRRDNGFWRDFGFGMTCQYKNDFNDIGGFDLTIKGWGSEDVLLYRKYTRSTKYQVIRTPVDSLFHHWHPKHCDKSLSLEQYNACLRTRSMTEGSQIQLGMLYLEEKDESKDV